MKRFGIFNITKTNNDKWFKILGLPLYVRKNQKLTHSRFVKKTSYFFNIFYTEKMTDYENGEIEKIVRLIGLPIYRLHEKNKQREHFIFSFLILRQDLIAKIRDEIGIIDGKYDGIYILRCNLGELYNFLAYIYDETLRKNKIKKPFIVTTKKYHQDVLQLFDIQAPSILKENLFLRIDEKEFYLNHEINQKAYIFFYDYYFINLEKTFIKNNGYPTYIESAIEYAGLNKINSVKKIQRKVETGRILEEKIKNEGLNKERFIIVSPDAHTCHEVPIEFWENLIKYAQNKNCDVYLNTLNNYPELEKYSHVKKFALSICEVYELACFAKKIIMIRSGLSEILIQTQTPMYAICTIFKHHEVDEKNMIQCVMTAYGLKHHVGVNLEHVEEVSWYNINDRSVEELNLLEGLK